MSNVKFDIPEWVNWLARDANGSLYGYRNKPNKGVATWCIGSVNVEQINCYLVSDDPSFYPQVKWEDEEPKAYKDGLTVIDFGNDGLLDFHTNQVITALQNFGRYSDELLEPVEEELEVGSVKFEIPEWVNWLARDNNGALYGYRNKPVEGLDMWGVTGDSNDFEEVVVSFITDDLEYYPEVKWSDEEPKPFKDGIILTDTEVDDLTDEKGEKITIEDALRWGFKTVNQIREGTENTTEPDMVNTPPHYKQYSFEPIDIITEVVKEYPPEIGFHIGTTLKYLFRSPFKGKQLQDIEKAEYYLQRAIKELTDE